MSSRYPKRSAKPEFHKQEEEDFPQQPHQQEAGKGRGNKKRYGPGQLLPTNDEGLIRAPRGGCDLYEDGTIECYPDPEETGVEHLGPGQILPGGGRAGPEGADVPFVGKKRR
ncbi:hypothetical protein RCL1_002216 [Eukaryota sp. TZLM3-RCL]